MKATNCMEDAVRQTLISIMEQQKMEGICLCPRCQEDIIALALNHLPPCYVTSDRGEVLARTKINLDYDMRASIYSEVMKAIMQVGRNPHHTDR